MAQPKWGISTPVMLLLPGMACAAVAGALERATQEQHRLAVERTAHEWAVEQAEYTAALIAYEEEQKARRVAELEAAVAEVKAQIELQRKAVNDRQTALALAAQRRAAAKAPSATRRTSKPSAPAPAPKVDTRTGGS